MTRSDVLAAAVLLALLLAVTADGIALQARRHAARALISAHTHRRRDDPPPAPRNLAVDRRTDDRGPPPGEPERRRHRAPDDDGRARRRDTDNPQYRVTGRPLTEQAEAVHWRFPRETITGSGAGPAHPQGIVADDPVEQWNREHNPARHRDATPSEIRVVDQPLTRDQADAYAARIRRELHLDDQPTGELNPPTRDMRTINPHDWPDR